MLRSLVGSEMCIRDSQIGRRHLSLFHLTGIKLVAVVDPSEGASSLAREHGVPLYTELHQLMEAKTRGEIQVDGAILATPNNMHAEGAITCAKHGVPAMIEKPVASSLLAAEHMLQELTRYKVPMLVGHHRRHSAAMSAAMETIASGRLGRIVSVSGHAQFYKPEHYFTDGPWRTKKGGGPVLINVIHDIDNMRALCGEVTEVQAISSNAVRGYDVEDTVVVNLKFSSGCLGSLTLSDTATGPMSWEQTSGENKDYGRDTTVDCYFVAGTRAALAIPTMRIWSNPGEESNWFKPLQVETLEVEEVNPLECQLLHFCELIRGIVEPKASVTSAMESLRVVDGILEAMRTGRTVSMRPHSRL
eukprot:TRINITY_DN8312_c0_g2_i1.p1 TRINITY_DN8312_c0_g2~~TRINITY_DN8312_c0_g2_i1.p1  ORF type:complete len:368 (-),score=87.13 TRINITY_DN8312_c0_g2_i1:168-1247(-)